MHLFPLNFEHYHADSLIRSRRFSELMRALKGQSLSHANKLAATRSKLIMSFDYIFGRGTSKRLDFEKFDFQYSRRTGRVRYVVDKHSKAILFTLRPNGSVAPTILGARSMLGTRIPKKSRPRWVVTVIDGVSDVVGSGKTVFCRHVAACSNDLIAGEDVMVANQRGDLLAVGKTVVPASVMKQFKKGVAVKVREGIRGNGSSTIA